ncbi:MAG: HAD family hydrolase [Theionarchaea archaeon]|nr:HAD family hydrolase [Theionarchaea archaeon]
MLTTVIFDLDGTLTDCDLTLAKHRVSRTLSAIMGQPYEIVLPRMNHIHYIYNIEGVYDRNEWWDGFCTTLPPSEKQALTDLYWKSVMETTRIKPHAEDVLATLKEMGMCLVLLTDFDGKSFSKQKRLDMLPIMEYFDLTVIAGDDTQEVKPSLEPFQYILTQLQIDPSQALMIGDKPSVDLSGADSMGMHTLLLVGDYGDEWKNSIHDLREILPFVRSLQEGMVTGT